MNKGHVYIMYSHNQNAFKIGESNNVKQRFSQGSTWVFDLKLIETYVFPSKKLAQSRENYVHKRYKSKRILKDREWFRLDEVDVMEVDKILKGENKIFWPRKIYLKARLKFLKLRKWFSE